MAAVAERTANSQYTTNKNEYNFQTTPPKTLGFDLLLETWRIHEPEQLVGEKSVMEQKEDRFKKNAETYINEALHVGIAKYEPYRIERTGRETTLTADTYEGPVREIFNPDNPKTKEKWPLYRKTPYHYKRAFIEYERFKSLEKSLHSAEVGDTYIWISPPPYEVISSDLSTEEKKKALEDQGFGFHTNTFVFTVEDDHKLQGRVIQNYLRAEDHREILKVLLDTDIFTENPNELQLLNRIAKLPIKNMSAVDIKSLMDQIYNHTPDELKIKPTHAYEKQMWTDEERMKQIHQYVEPFLGYIFQLLRHTNEQEVITNHELQDFIATRFHIWEQTVVDLHQGTNINLESIQQILEMNSQDITELAQAEIQIVKKQKGYKNESAAGSDVGYGNQQLNQYAAFIRSQNNDSRFATGCGIGSGFSGGVTYGLTSSSEQSMGILPTNYIGAEILKTRSLGMEMRHEKYKCPKCQTEILGEVIGSHPSTWTPICPKEGCNYVFPCAKDAKSSPM